MSKSSPTSQLPKQRPTRTQQNSGPPTSEESCLARRGFCFQLKMSFRAQVALMMVFFATHVIAISGALDNSQLRLRIGGCKAVQWDVTHMACADVPNWDTSQVTDMSELFWGDSGLPIDISRWDTGSVVTMRGMFRSVRNWNGDISRWNTSSVNDMSEMFDRSDFNGNISSWDTSSVTDMSYMFYFSSNFNGDLSRWNTSSVINMDGMFGTAYDFRGDISTWNTGRVTSMKFMFYEAYSFAGKIGGWDVSNVESMQGMFYLCCYADGSGNFGLEPFDTDFSAWNTGRVTNMHSMFESCYFFNGSVAGWDVSRVTDMANMFYEAAVYREDLSSWNTSSVIDMQGMFRHASDFRGDISTWNTGKVTSMHRMFFQAYSFAGKIGGWDVSRVTDMEAMFFQAENFNDDLSQWDTSAVERMNFMFNFAKSFNGDVSTWNTGSVTTMRSMFDSAEKFNSDISRWDTSSVTNMLEIFDNALLFNVDLCAWDRSNAVVINAFRNSPKLSFCDVNECVAGICDGNSTCVNSDGSGSFICTCNFGYSGDGLSCQENDCITEDGYMTCYLSLARAEQWDTAMSSCWNLGGHLPVVLSRAQNDFIFDVAQGDAWLGLTRIGRFGNATNETMGNASNSSVGGYLWVTDGPGEPVDGIMGGLDGSDCIRIAGLGFWEDSSCFASHHVVCQMGVSCAEGYSGSGEVCYDDDECARAYTNNCDTDAICTNTNGSFLCACNAGFVDWSDGLGTRCDVNQCALNSTHDCAEQASCHDTDGSFECVCVAGYGGTICEKDLDECAGGVHNCDTEATCTNTVGSFVCACGNGTESVDDGATCFPGLDECSAGTHNCNVNGTCTNTIGSFECACAPGYESEEGAVNGTCYAGLDECLGSTHTCPVFRSTCSNTLGSFTCACNAGYTGNGVDCSDVDECAAGNNSCHADAICINNPGSYSCECMTGFSGDGKTCVDDDECALDSNSCQGPSFACKNTKGSFSCICNDGFESDDYFATCVSGTDECLSDIDTCHPDAECTNTIGSFLCACKPGFSGDGLFCRGGPCGEHSRCHADAFCQDPEGSGAQCFCPEGSSGDGRAKQDGGTECRRDSWSVRLTMDLGMHGGRNPGQPPLTNNGERLFYWDRDRSELGDLFFSNPQTKPSGFDSSMYHVVTIQRFLTVNALFLTEAEAEEGLKAFNNHTDAGVSLLLFRTASSGVSIPAALTTPPAVVAFAFRTSESEIRVLPTGFEILNVYFKPSCLSSGCWVVDLIYTSGEDNFNVFYIPKAVGNETLSFDFDYEAIPDYAAPYGKSPADTFLPRSFPCGSDGYEYKSGPYIPHRVSACCIEEFTKMYRPVDTFLNDPKIQMVLAGDDYLPTKVTVNESNGTQFNSSASSGPSREEFCAGPEYCASEGGLCDCVGRVQYGANGRFFYLESDGPIACTREVFGDPVPGVNKTCSCSPRRIMWSKEDMPASALVGNFSGMEGLARVDFGTVLDSFVKVHTASVYLDEKALRSKAGILTGITGVSHAIDTFIGFANFKPTGLEFLDMFAVQTNIHLERTSFFTVSAYGENDYTFLEYINLRLVDIYNEDDFTYPFTFDEYLLTATFDEYPTSPTLGNGTIGAESRVWITSHLDGGYSVSYYLTGLTVGETSGGIHIHEGTSCAAHDQVLGHFYATPTDPWTATMWTKEASSSVASGTVVVNSTGLRVGCGILQPRQDGFTRTSPVNSAHYLQVTFTMGEQYQPIETGIIPIDSVLISKGDFITSQETIDTRFHACQQYHDGSFPELRLFKSRFPTKDTQTCAPNVTMCHNPKHISDQFVHFNIPLGIDWLPDPSDDLDANVFVSLVVSVLNSHQIAEPSSFPNNGDFAEQMKTTLTASIPVVEGGKYVFCDTIVVRDNLLDVANADLMFGSASSEYEYSRLKIVKDIASPSAFLKEEVEKNSTYIDTESIEAGLMTLVIKGNATYFARTPGFSLELEDVITIHIMEPDTGTMYDEVLSLIFTPGREVSATNGFALNGAFVFTVDRSEGRASLDPTIELNNLCPFKPQRPNPNDAFPSTCVSRRDVRRRGYPAEPGQNATAIELPAANVALDDPEREHMALFMQAIINPSEYSAQLGRNFSYIVGQKYELNGVYNRAFWINPGYEWTPQQTAGQSIFTLSQKVIMYALINLNEGFVRRRMLLQSATGGPEDKGAGAAGQQATFATTPQSMMASLYNIPVALVATFRVELALAGEVACFGTTDLRRSVRVTLDAHVSETTTNYETVQVMSMTLDKGEVQCPTSNRRSLPRALGEREGGRRLFASSGDATATADIMIVFSPSDFIAIDVQRFAKMESVNAVTPLEVSDLIQITSFNPSVTSGVYGDDNEPDWDDDIWFKPKDDSPDSNNPSEETNTSSGGFEKGTIVITAAVGGVVLLAFASFLVYHRYRKQSSVREVDVVGSIDVMALKAELAIP